MKFNADSKEHKLAGEGREELTEEEEALTDMPICVEEEQEEEERCH